MSKRNLWRLLISRQHYRRENTTHLTITSPNGVRDQGYLEIGGIKQWVTVRGNNRANPILLFIHGGPGSTYSIFNSWLVAWEKDFTIIQWDQRGAGKTFRFSHKDGENLSLARLAQDGIEVVEYLCRNFKQQKVILVGSSVGSLTGVMMAKLRPDLFYAYVGTDQNSPDPGQLSRKLALEAFQAAGHKKGIKLLQKIEANQFQRKQRDFVKLNQYLLQATRGVPDMVQDLILPALLTSPDHTFKDILDYFRGMNFSLKYLLNEIINFDFDRLGRKFDLPFFIIQGKHDLITPTRTTQDFFAEIEAPQKEIFLVEQAGHLACFARPEIFLELLLKYVRPLATSQAATPDMGVVR